MNGKTLEEVDQFKYLGSTQTFDKTSIKEVKIRMAQTYSAMTWPTLLWKNKAISFPTKIKLCKSFALSKLLFGCVSWTLKVDLERQIQAFENKCYRSISSPDVRRFCCQLSVKRRELSSWFGHVCRHDTLPKVLLQGTVDSRHCRGLHKSWKDNIKQWISHPMSSLLHIADDRGRWAVIAAEASIGIPQRRLGVTGIS